MSRSSEELSQVCDGADNPRVAAEDSSKTPASSEGMKNGLEEEAVRSLSDLKRLIDEAERAVASVGPPQEE